MDWTLLVFLMLFLIKPENGKQLVSNPGIKTWTVNLDFHNSKFWNGGQLPRSCDRAVIPPQATVSIYVQSNITVRELILPMNGEIVLGSGAAFILEENSQECNDRKDVTFTPPTASYWYSPDSWSVSADDLPETPNPVPETERIPCQQDRVVFPVDSTYQVKIDGPPIAISSLSIAGKDLNTSDFETLLETDSGKLHFTSSKSVIVSNSSCSESVGCACGNDRSDVKLLACSLATCKELDCSDPLKPVGSCCPLCGAMVTINYKSGFEFSKLHKLYSSFMNKSEYQTISGYLSNIGGQRVQAIFADAFETHRAAGLAGAITNYLTQDMNQVGSYGITSIKFDASSHWIEHYRLTKGLSLGEVTALSLAFVALVVLSIYLSTKYKKYSLSSLSFKRLQELDYDIADEDQEVQSFASEQVAKGFDNPMYDELKFSAKEALESSDEAESKVVSTEMRENPAFTVFEELEHLTQESLLE